MTMQRLVQVGVSGAGVVSRRGFLRGSAAAAGLGLALPPWLAAHAETLTGRPRACILLWMQGGPSQFETFDPKPEHANGAGTRTIATATPGITIAQGWERTARVMPDVALIRSMTNREGNHQRATYQLHTSYAPTGTLKHPAFGSVVASELGEADFDLPHIVSVGGPTVGAGFLGVGYEPFQVADPDRPPANLERVVSEDRFRRRLELLDELDSAGRRGGTTRAAERRALYRQTAGMVLSPRVRAFDLEREDSAVRDSYGRTPFGQGCLLARRLVEEGVRFIEVRSSGNWDTHQQNAERTAELAAATDPGLAALIGDLKQRGLLETTLVVWMGEFGRTPRINPNAGRDHYPAAFSVAVAGAGIRGGQVIGRTSPDGVEITDRPVTVPDLLASFCQALGIDASKENMSPVGRPIRIVDGGTPVRELFG